MMMLFRHSLQTTSFQNLKREIEMGVPVRPAGVMGADNLSEKAAKMRESLLKSQSITDNMVSILGSFDHRLSALETAMRPTQIRTHAIRRAHENIDRTLKSADVILDRFDLSREAEAKILRGPHEDLESYLEAIEQLRSNIVFFTNNKSFKSSDGVISHASNLLSKAISKLEQEYKQLLSSYSKSVDPDRLYECLPSSLRPSSGSPDANGKNPSNSHTGHITAENAVFAPLILIPPRVLPLLHDLAQHMVQAGHLQQCLVIYRDTRSIVLEETLQKLGVEKLSKDDVQKMQWEVLELKIGTWIHFMRIAVKLLFTAERKICDQMFKGIESLRDQCFAEVTAGSVAMLLSFGDAIAKSKRSPEKLFVLLDMYEIMRELHSEIESLFRGKACKEIRESALGLTKRLAQTAQETFGDFEEAVEKDATKTAVSDGTVHPLTSYVINYVKFLFDYQMTLKQLFQEFENGRDSNSQLASVTMRIMQALQINLEGKSKQYKDPALTNLFLMNNIHYMVRSEAKDLLGDDWVQRHRRVVQQHANQALRSLEKVDSVKYLQTSQCNGESASTSRGKEKVEENGPRKFPVPFNMLTTSTNGNGDVAVLKESAQAVAIDDDESALKLPPEPPQKRPAFQMSAPEIDDDDDDDDDIIHVNGHVSFPPVENNNKLETSPVVNKPVTADILEVTTPPEVFKTPAPVEATPVVVESAKDLEPEKAKPPPKTDGFFGEKETGFKFSSTFTAQKDEVTPAQKVSPFQFSDYKPKESSEPKLINSTSVFSSETKNDQFKVTNTDDKKLEAIPAATSASGMLSFSSSAKNSSGPTVTPDSTPCVFSSLASFPASGGNTSSLFNNTSNSNITPATTSSLSSPTPVFSFGSGKATNSMPESSNTDAVIEKEPKSTISSSPFFAATTAAATTPSGGGLFGFSSPAAASTAATTTTTTNGGGLFGFSSPAATSTTTAAAATNGGSGLFGFSAPAATSTTTTTTTSAATNGGGLFGFSAPAATSTAAAAANGGAPFGFSSPAATSTTTTTTTSAATNAGALFSFGAPAATSTTATATNGGSPFGFSAPATTSTTTTTAAAATNGGALFGFGAPPSTSTTTNATNSGALFGFSAPATTSTSTTTTTTTTASPLFGFSSPSPTTTPTNSFFNTTTASQTNPSSTTTTQSAPFQFASGPTTSPFTSSAPTFGITPVSEAKSGNSTTTTVFGSSWQQPPPQNPPVFSFGASSSASPTPITFGAPKTTPQSSSSSSSSMFGQPAAAPGFMFGAPVAAPAPFQFCGAAAVAPQNPFQSSNVEFNGGGGSFSLGSGGEKAGRRIVRVNKSKNIRK